MQSDADRESKGKVRFQKWKIVTFFSILAGVILTACIIILFIFPDIYLNKYFKNRIIKEVKSAYPGSSIKISKLNFQMLENRIKLSSVYINSGDSVFSCGIDNLSLSGIGWLKLIMKGSLDHGYLLSLVADASGIVLIFRKSQYQIRCNKLDASLMGSFIEVRDLQVSPLVDDDQYFEESKFRKTRLRMVLPKLKISGLAFNELLQGKKYRARSVQISDANLDVLVNMFKPIEKDTALQYIKSDEELSIKERISIDSISFLRTRIKYGESYALNSNASYGYNFRCGALIAAIKKTELTAKDLQIYPLMDDNEFFAESKYRKTRLKMILSKLKVSGLSYKGLLAGNEFKARSVQIHKMYMDILVNMYKPFKRLKTKTLMLNEFFSAIPEKIHLDSLNVLSGHLIYSESFAKHLKPGVLLFNNLRLHAEGLTNYKKAGDTLRIKGSTNIVNAGLMKVAMTIPLSSPKFSMNYSGSLSSMALNKLNVFLEAGEYVRIKSGLLNSASFNIQVNNGRANGSFRSDYKDFSLAFLSKTGSEKGMFRRIKSFLANTLKIHGTNQKDKSGALKLGKINYSRKWDDTFTQYIWFALRSGIGDIVGF